jgi:ABC-type lipoprotein export system ATPase subunit
MTAAEPLIELRDVSKRFGSPEGSGTVAVLESVSLRIGKCESMAVLGPSGSGKSTLLHILGTLDQPTAGEVRFNGRSYASLDERELARLRNSELGFVFQAHYLLPQCTVFENVLVPSLVRERRGTAESGSASSGAEESPENRATRLLERVGLGHRLGHFPGQLSGGERQRVAVVRALVNQPLALLADEPTGSLDHNSAVKLGTLLTELNQEEGVALVVVTHSRELAAKMKRVLELRDGKLVEELRA